MIKIFFDRVFYSLIQATKMSTEEQIVQQLGDNFTEDGMPISIFQNNLSSDLDVDETNPLFEVSLFDTHHLINIC